MEDLNKIFQTALGLKLTRRGDQAALARQIGMSTTTLGDIKSGRRNASDEKKRALAKALGYPGRQYENFLDLGRPDSEQSSDYVPQGDLTAAGYFPVPLDQADRLGAGGIHALGQAKPEEVTTLMVHGDSIGRNNGRNLRAYVVGGDSMEPLIGDGGLVVADLSRNKLANIKDGGIYVIGWDEEGSVKYLRWAEKDKLLAVESENKFYKTMIKRPKEVTLIGQVIWSCRQHKS
jgi:phage repressor protein C with HTH and peptisase S24 domain